MASASNAACFVCTVDPTTLTGLRRQLDRMLDPDTDSIYVFRQCTSCWGAAGLHGQAARQEQPIYWASLSQRGTDCTVRLPRTGVHEHAVAAVVGQDLLPADR
jgi:hypothetical protein